ncbi:hypothetical protein SLA2020_183590 [Shorea laevis]
MKLASFTAISHFLLLCCIMFFSPYFNNLFVSGGTPHQHAQPAISGSAQGYKGMLIAPRYGPCSPLGQEKSYAVSAQMLLQDELRVQSINSLAPSKYVDDTHDKETHQLRIPGEGRLLDGGNYVVQLGFGTPKRDFNLILDTGSNATWIKCKPCRHCGKPKTIFDPNSSSTFRKTHCNESNCSFGSGYLDNSSFEGFWASDTLTISPPHPIQNFNFVCVNKTGIKDASGLLALGQGDNSLVSQTGTNVFCHCLPSEHATGYLLFDSEARKRCRVKNFTALKPQKDNGRYMVNFTGISIGNKTFTTTSSSQDAMIDSGTVITRLPPSVYEQFRFVFRKLMEEYSLVKRPPNERTLETCYELKGDKHSTVEIPTVVLHFENLDVNLTRSQVLWQEENSSVYCLAFAGNEDVGNMVIIGNHQLQKLNVLYDIQGSKVGIGPGNCG